jgi:hypothetical protein
MPVLPLPPGGRLGHAATHLRAPYDAGKAIRCARRHRFFGGKTGWATSNSSLVANSSRAKGVVGRPTCQRLRLAIWGSEDKRCRRRADKGTEEASPPP